MELDDRQRAMLSEIGLHLVEAWPRAAQPAEAVAPAPAMLAPVAPVAVVAEPVAKPASQPQPPAQPARSREDLEGMPWDALAEAAAGCQACGLCQGRRNAVFGVGDQQADWLLVGEAPDESEDLQGEPFAGPSGKLLDNMLASVGLDRARGVFLSNVLKCRPPGNRAPTPEEAAQCEPLLRRQVALVQPKVILAMGRLPAQSMLDTAEPLGKLRGRVHQYQGIPVVVTFHPSYLLRNLPDKARAWADLCLAMDVAEGRHS